MLNKQGKGKIDWTDYTWNPITGCLKGCDYCYMKRLEKRFGYDMTPKFHPDKLNDIEMLGKPSKIFVCSTGDMWGEWVDKKWIEKVLAVVRQHPQHTFQFLTKNPERYLEFDLPFGWYGATVDGTGNTARCIDWYSNSMPVSIQPLELVRNKNKDVLTFYSFEPLLSRKHLPMLLDAVDWIIIGADSNPRAKQPKKAWVDYLICNARAHGVNVFIKDNLKYKTNIKFFPRGRISSSSRQEALRRTYDS